jgi:DNA-binding response OmpR family regulator
MARILAEGDHDIRWMIQRILGHEGHAVGFADDARSILARLDREPCDLLVLDDDRSFPNTRDVLALLLRRRGRKVPIVVLTGDPYYRTVPGVDCHVMKTFMVRELPIAVEYVLAVYGMRAMSRQQRDRHDEQMDGHSWEWPTLAFRAGGAAR